MANAAIAHYNLIDVTGVVISASGAVLLAQPTNLVNPHVGKKWRVNASSAYVLFDLLSLQIMDTIMLAGVSGSNPDFRVRISTVDATGVAGDAYDSATISGAPYFDPKYGLFVALLPSAAVGRYLRIDIAEAGVTYIEAGRAFAGMRTAFNLNYQTPWVRTPMRASLDVIGVGGQTYIDLRRGFWKQSARFGFIEESEALGFIEDISVAIVNNGHRDMLWIRNPASANLSRDCIWGYLDAELSLTQSLYLAPALYEISVSVRQRL